MATSNRIKSGIFIIAPIPAPVGDRIAALQATHDPRLIRLGAGMGAMMKMPLLTRLAIAMFARAR